MMKCLLQAIYDESNKHKQVIALEIFNVLHNSLAQSAYTWRWPNVVCVKEQ